MPRMEAVAQRGGPRPDTSRMSAFSCPGGKAARYGQPAAEGPAAFDRRCILPALRCFSVPWDRYAPSRHALSGRPSPVSLQRGVLPRRPREQPGAVAASVPASAAPSAVSPAQQPPSTAASAELEALFWQSIANSTNPAEFEAYLRRFPNGMFSELAQIRLEALRSPVNDAPASAGRPTGGVGSPGTGSRVSGAGGDAPRRPGDVFRDCDECPEMVVLPGGGLAMGRYEVTVGEYRAFVSATGGNGRRWLGLAGPRLSADGPSSGDLRELGRRAGVCVVAEPADWRGVSVADGGGVGAGGVRVSGGMLPRPHGEHWNVPGGFVRLERGGPVGHGR